MVPRNPKSDKIFHFELQRNSGIKLVFLAALAGEAAEADQNDADKRMPWAFEAILVMPVS